MSRADADAPSVLRLVTFSDAVFAIAITLLALQLRVPTIKDPKSASQLARALGDQGTEFSALPRGAGELGKPEGLLGEELAVCVLADRVDQ